MPSLRDRLFRRAELREDAIQAAADELRAVSTLDDLRRVLPKHRANPHAYRIGGSATTSYNIEKTGDRWTAGWDGGRPGESDLTEFETEREACQALLASVLGDTSWGVKDPQKDFEAIRRAWRGW